MRLDQKGFGGLLVILVIAVAAAAGYFTYQTYVNNDDSQQAVSDSSLEPVPEVDSTGDLDKVKNYLDSLDFENDLDSSQLDSETEGL